MLKEIYSVTCFLEFKGEVLILLRSDRVRTYRGIWGGVSGRIQNKRVPLEQAKLEVKEETGLSEVDFNLIKEGTTLIIDDFELKIRKVVFPFLFKIKDPGKIKIDWEHTQSKWIKPSEITGYQTMPQLEEALARVFE
jgi:8-oxo-dGTP diphosphatase